MNPNDPKPLTLPGLSQPAPAFEAKTTHGPKRLADYRDRWLVLFSHPADFTPVCTTEFAAFARAFPRFQALGCDLLGLSIDSTHAHIAWWSGRHYDRYVDKEVRFLRHALAIDEDRAKFPRVGWGRPTDLRWHKERGREDWLVQTWFAGNHSDIGGSYPEEESRLSDIALRWMVEELKVAMGDAVTVLEDRLVTSPDPLGLQHSERTGMLNSQPSWLRIVTRRRLVWTHATRDIHSQAQLHPTVLERLAAPHVPQMGEVKAYRPESLREHQQAQPYIA